MSRLTISRKGFIGSTAAATALGLAGCAGGASVGGTPIANASSTPKPAGISPTATPAPTPTATSAASTSAAYPGPSISSGNRLPGSRPNPAKPAGYADPTLPFDTIVVVMMENHSFDNYFGMLPKRGQPLADGFTFDASGKPTNKNPVTGGGYQHVFHLDSTCQPGDVDQSWKSTKAQVGDGSMDGFANNFSSSMGYWDEPDIPYYYSLAKTFCVGNRSFCSTTSQTYPNRRFYMAGTSSGCNETSVPQSEAIAYPPAGTIFDSMTSNGVTWANYYTDFPNFIIIPQNVENHPSNLLPISNYFTAAASGTLPNVSIVEPEYGVVSGVGSGILGIANNIPNPPASVQAVLAQANGNTNGASGSEEQPGDIAIGELFVQKVIAAAMASPQWKRMLVVWTYDEHGGYYDHVPPAAAVLPDDIPPILQPGDPAGSYDTTGIRIPTVVASPYSKPNAVSNVPHDHTALLATIQAKWNLPALTHRDAQSATLFDYLDFTTAHFATPPTLAAPSNPATVNGTCSATPPPQIVTPNTTTRKPKTARRSDTHGDFI